FVIAVCTARFWRRPKSAGKRSKIFLIAAASHRGFSIHQKRRRADIGAPKTASQRVDLQRHFGDREVGRRGRRREAAKSEIYSSREGAVCGEQAALWRLRGRD